MPHRFGTCAVITACVAHCPLHACHMAWRPRQAAVTSFVSQCCTVGIKRCQLLAAKLQFVGPEGMGQDADGNILVADYLNNR